MKKISSIICFAFVLSFFLHGQEKTIVITPDLFDEQQRIPLANMDGWIFREGTDENWSQVEIDLSDWQSMKPTQLTPDLEDENGRLEGWFRIKFKLSNAFDTIPLSLDRRLWVATSIFLDGNLVETFGETGINKSDFKYYNPNHKIPTTLNLIPGREYLLAIHFVNYEEIFTPGKVKLNEENLETLVYMTGPHFTDLEQHYRRSSYIHSTLWNTASIIFMLLFWIMAVQNPNERIFKLIAILSVVIFLEAVSKGLLNFFELSFFQEKIRYLIYGANGPLINVLVVMITEWIIKGKNTTLSKSFLIIMPITSVVAHLYNFSAPFGIANTALTGYFIYLIFANRKQFTKVQWAVVLAMSFYILFVNFYLILRKVSMKDYLIYGNLIFSILLLVPLIAFLIYVSLKFKEIIQDKINAQQEKTNQLEAINAASAKFVPSTFLNFLGKKNILDATLGDYVEKQVTVLFSDIRDYTSLSEKMTPEENFRFVNAYNQRMGPIIQNHNGFVNQYLGDGIMAIFPENTEDTLLAAIGMQKELINYNQHRISKNKTPIRMGIGLHAGPLIMGIIGDVQRMDAATISDTVNVASRIEGLTKYYGANILLSEGCVNKMPEKEKYNLRYLGLVQVKGKEETVKIYECFDGDSGDMILLKKETMPDFEKGMDLYFSKHFSEAENIFRNILLKNPEDKSARLFFEKTTYLRNNGVDASWTGVERMTEK